MKHVYTATAQWDAPMMRDLLISRGIEAIVEDRYDIYRAGTARVHILNDGDEARALDVVREFRANVTERPPDTAPGWNWRCTSCREEVEPQFETCWNCGTQKPRD